MLKDQDGKCKCCSERFKDTKTTHVDYCAESKTVRSLLCVNCNVALAYLKGNSEKAAHLLNYILSQKHNGS